MIQFYYIKQGINMNIFLSDPNIDLDKTTFVAKCVFEASFIKTYDEDKIKTKQYNVYIEFNQGGSLNSEYLIPIVEDTIKEQVNRFELSAIYKSVEYKYNEKQYPLSTKDYLNGVGLCERAGYYSGYGATTDNLKSEQLFKLRESILLHEGTQAAKGFVKMIANLPIASATAFLNSFYNFYDNGWLYDENLISKSGCHAENMGEAMGTVMMGMVNDSNRDDTQEIVSDFLKTFGETHILIKDMIKNGENVITDKYGSKMYFKDGIHYTTLAESK